MKLPGLNSTVNIVKQNKVIMKFVSSTFLSIPVSLVVSFIVLRYIDPYFMGVWSALTIIETYANVLRFGVVNGMNRELPYYMGSGKTDEALSFARSTLGFSLLNSLLILLALPFVFGRFELNATYISCLAVVMIRTMLSFYTTYLAGTFRTTDHFNKLSNIQYILLVAKLAMIPLIIYSGFNGYLVMELALALINALLLHIWRPFRLRPELKMKVLVLLMKTGVPLFVTSYLVSLVDTFPRLYIVYFGNETLLGLYAPVLMIITTFAMLPTTLGTYFYPKLTYLFGKNNNAREIWNKLVRIYLYTSLLILVICAVAYFLLDELIKLFPKYTDALPYMKISLLAGPFVLSKLGNLINVVMKKVNYMGMYVTLYAFFQVLFLFLVSLYSDDVLVCAVVSQVLTSFALFIASYYLNHRVVINFVASKQ